jgi:hypothetical protein
MNEFLDVHATSRNETNGKKEHTMKNTKLAAMNKKSFLQRLLGCTKGENAVVVGIVATGIAISAAALVGSRTQTSVGNAATTIGTRTAQGAAGSAPLGK